MTILTKDADTVVRLKTQLDEGLGYSDDVPHVLGVRPLNPDPIPLDGQGCVARYPGHCFLEHTPERFRGDVRKLTPLSLPDDVIESDLDRHIRSGRNKLNIVN